MMKVVAVVPARYASTRLPAKPLADLCGKPLIQWVYEKALQSKLCHQVIVATDDPRIESAVKKFGGNVMMTSPDLPSGTDRMAAVARQVDADVFVNIQGDEPLIDIAAVDSAIQAVLDRRFDLTTLRVPLRSQEALKNLNVVKVLVDDHQRAIYFSRYPIPYSRIEASDAQAPFLCWQHVGVYVYRKETLFEITSLPQAEIEKAESLEQLRALKAGIAIGVFPADFESIGVDTPEDLEKVRKILGK